jgi:hypothetical protein
MRKGFVEPASGAVRLSPDSIGGSAMLGGWCCLRRRLNTIASGGHPRQNVAVAGQPSMSADHIIDVEN